MTIEIPVENSTAYMIRENREEYNLAPLRERIRQLESERRVSQFCRDIDLSRNQLYLILSGKSNATEPTLVKILQGLGMTLKDVLL